MGRLLRLPGVAQLLGQRRILKDHIRRITVREHEADHTLFKAMVSDTTLPLDTRLQVQRLFETSIPRDAMATRVVNRCVLTGRPRSVHRFARLSRIMLRQLAHYGLLPGVTKASW
ncbi:mitochondrial ribosomal protein S14 [Haematococcus lacustris]